MRHFSPEEWVDFVNQTTSQDRVKVMENHLASGCATCGAQAAMWQKVRTFAAAEPGYQPPSAAVRLAGALFSATGAVGVEHKPSGFVELLFDSFLQPALAGMRTAGTGMRQMLYRAESFQIDMQIEVSPDTGRILVTGQVLDVRSPEVISRGMRVVLSNRRGNVVHAVTNEFGEFHVEIQNSGDLELSLHGESGAPIVISLKDPLADLPEGGEL